MINNKLTVIDVSKRLKVNVQTVRKWIRKGELKAKLKIDGDLKSGYLINYKDFEAFVKGNEKYKAVCIKNADGLTYGQIFNEILEMNMKTISHASSSEEYEKGYKDAVMEIYNRIENLFIS